MNYKNIYTALIESRLANVPTGVTESHHIVPRCQGGNDSDSNIVKLTPRDHFVAHLLLCAIYPDNPKLQYAFNMMCNAANNKYQVRKKYNSKLYNSIKLKVYDNLRKYANEHMIIYNPITLENIKIRKDAVIPDGWVFGTSHKNTLGKIRFYNKNTDNEIMIFPDEVVPDGYVKGRRPFTWLYAADGSTLWDTGQCYDKTKWFTSPVHTKKYIHIYTGDAINLTPNDKIPPGYVASNTQKDRKITCKHIITGVVGVLTEYEYLESIHWIRTGITQTHLYATDVGLVRNKADYIRISGRSLNIRRYCKDNSSVVSEWLVNRSNLPAEWAGKTWHELGFGIVEF